MSQDRNNFIGQQFGSYHIIEKLGQGGMAEVYKGYQPQTEQFVAIKVMHAFWAEQPTAVRRFQQEALSWMG